jgi:hypothetical protein
MQEVGVKLWNENIFSTRVHLQRAVESILHDLLVNVHIAISDKRTSDEEFPVITNKFSFSNLRLIREHNI